ncbi:hypothetical protein BVX93_02325, partial [bacterium B13(2017)]
IETHYEWISGNLEIVDPVNGYDSKNNVTNSEVLHYIIDLNGNQRFQSGELLLKQYDPIKGYTRQSISAKYRLLIDTNNSSFDYSNANHYLKEYLQVETSYNNRHDFRGNATDTDSNYLEIYDSVAEAALQDNNIVLDILEQAMIDGVNELSTYDSIAQMRYGIRMLSDHFSFKNIAKNQWVFEKINSNNEEFLPVTDWDIDWNRGKRRQREFYLNGLIKSEIEGNFMINQGGFDEETPKNSDVTMVRAKVTINHSYDYSGRNVAHLEEKVFQLDHSAPGEGQFSDLFDENLNYITTYDPNTGEINGLNNMIWIGGPSSL